MEVSLYKHQYDAVEKMKNGCILCGEVGTGKSRTSLAYYAIDNGAKLYFSDKTVRGALSSPRPLYIITTAKKRDSSEWLEECRPFEIKNLTVDSWNNIKKYRKVYGAWFIFDEQRVVGYGAWTKAFLDITRKNKWILLSATPGDTWKDYIPVFVANGFYSNKTDFMRRHAVVNNFGGYPKIDHYVDTGILLKYRRSILVKMPFKRPTESHNVYIPCEYDKVLYKTVWRDRWNPYKNEPIEKAAEVCYVLRRVVNSDPSRLKPIDQIITRHQRVIIFYNFTYELEAIKLYLSEYDNLAVAEWNGKKHEEIPKTATWVYLVQYAAGAEGWNCIETDAMIFYSQSYSYRLTIQAAGRIDRMNTKYSDLYYYRFRSSAPIDIAIQRALNAKENFNETDFLKH